MQDDDLPIVYARLPDGTHGAGLVCWVRRPDGWWAEVVCTDLVPSTAAGFGRHDIPIYTWAMSVHASLIQKREDVDYTHVPRIT